ncbi:thioredoxin family protein [Mycoplasma sp. Pen4]|uniref:thioredoxin family protein n=1 Tax=Mycoplasma sp. Pen4 TaxID=640330 RepID=UPI001654B95B|nr:thioredoxin family protein [Mycoplasma sp. Pen4]QNM93611.1 thioredoxin family protein [Mycoplasma sp. Pen4]
MLHEATKNDVLAALEKKEDLNLVVFYAEWCGPCRMYKSSLEELATKNNVNIYRVNIDTNKEYAQEAGVSSIPFTKVYKKGELVGETVGFKPYALLKDEVEAL